MEVIYQVHYLWRGLKELMLLQKISHSLLPRILVWEQEVSVLIFLFRESDGPKVLSVITLRTLLNLTDRIPLIT